MSGANYKCPNCGGRLRSSGDDWFTCRKCGEQVHEIAAKHRDVLIEWADRDDLDSAAIAKVLLGDDPQ